jgi:Flp pilus assembly pilin Flp
LRSDTEDEEEEEGVTTLEVVAVLVSRTFVAALVTLSSRPLEVFPEELECFS